MKFRAAQNPVSAGHHLDPSKALGQSPSYGGARNRANSDRQASTFKARITFASFVFAVYLLPPVLVLSGVFPFRHRFTLLSAVTGLVAVYVWLRGHRLAALGFRKDTLRKSAIYNLAVAGAALLIIAALFFSGVLPLEAPPEWRWFFLFYVLVSCPAQEFLFRSALFAEMDRAKITHRGWQIALSSILYCFPHVIYHSAITLCAVLVIGIAWSYGFSRSRNFWGVAASHCLLGAVSVLSGLI